MFAKLSKGLAISSGGGASNPASVSEGGRGGSKAGPASKGAAKSVPPSAITVVEQGDQRRRQEALQLLVEELGQARADSLAPIIRSALEVRISLLIY
jgi:hypothetical protein